MIKKAQEAYLATLPDGKVITVEPFDLNAQRAGQKIVAEVHAALPNHHIVFGGAAALGIAGQNDIDINILSVPEEYDTYSPKISALYGEPIKKGTSSIKWSFIRDGFEVELYLTNKDSVNVQEQLRVFELLSESKELRDEYEQVKMPFGPIDFKEYMRKKYAFYNKILGLKEE